VSRIAKKPAQAGVARAARVPDVDVGALRARLGLSQAGFARTFGLSLATLRNYEQGRTRPDGPAKVLLVVINKAPQAVMEALGVG
jgi:putative transcriptional regulator